MAKRQRENEAKAERLKRFNEQKLQQQHEKARKLEAKEAQRRERAVQEGADAANAWYCDVALDGCCRPCEGDYEPAIRYVYADDYHTCEACFLAHLTPEQQEALTRVEPPGWVDVSEEAKEKEEDDVELEDQQQVPQVADEDEDQDDGVATDMVFGPALPL